MTKIAIIGSGPSALGSLVGLTSSLNAKRQNLIEERKKKLGTQQLSDAEMALVDGQFKKITDALNLQIDIFERDHEAGFGLPYNSTRTAPEHLLNIAATSSISVDIMNNRDRYAFLRWMNAPENQAAIDQKLRATFVERFKRKFAIAFGENYDESKFAGQNIFDAEFKNSAGYKEYEKRFGARFAKLCEDYPKHCLELKERYITRVQNSEVAFFPRIIYGIYLQELFEKAKVNLGRFIGADKIKIHTDTAVEYLDKDKKIKYRQGEILREENFDKVLVGTGRWHEEPVLEGQDQRQIKQIWPYGNVEKAIFAAIEEAKSLGQKEVHIAIKGSSVTAVDMIKTSLFGGKFVNDENGAEIFIPAENDGVKIVVDVISRNGFLPKIRTGDIKFLNNDYQRYFPQALVDVARDVYGLELEIGDKSFAQIEKNSNALYSCIAQQSGTKPNFRHTFKLFGEILAQAYRNINSLASQSVQDFVDFVADEKNNYAAILEKFLSLRKQNAIAQLEEDIAASDQPEYHVFEHIFDMFDEYLLNSSNFPPEERLFLARHQSAILLPYDTAMPRQSAKDLVAYSKAGVLNVVACGFECKPDKAEAGGIVVDLGKNGLKKYDLTIEASGSQLNFKKTKSPLYQAFYNSFDEAQKTNLDREFSVDKIFCTQAEFEAQALLMKEKFGDKEAENLLRSVYKDESGDYRYSLGGAVFPANHASSDSPDVIFLCRNFGVNISSQMGKKAGEKILSDVLAKQPEFGVAASNPQGEALQSNAHAINLV